MLISNQLPSSVQPTVNVGGGSATTTVPVVYTTQAGTIEPVPVPEPASILAWGGLAGALVLLRRRHGREGRRLNRLSSCRSFAKTPTTAGRGLSFFDVRRTSKPLRLPRLGSVG